MELRIWQYRLKSLIQNILTCVSNFRLKYCASWWKQPEEEGLFGLHAIGYQQERLRQELESGTWSQELTQRPHRNADYWLLFVACSVCLIIQLGASCLGVVPSSVNRVLLDWSLFKKMLPRIAKWAVWRRQFLSWHSPFPADKTWTSRKIHPWTMWPQQWNPRLSIKFIHALFTLILHACIYVHMYACLVFAWEVCHP